MVNRTDANIQNDSNLASLKKKSETWTYTVWSWVSYLGIISFMWHSHHSFEHFELKDYYLGFLFDKHSVWPFTFWEWKENYFFDFKSILQSNKWREPSEKNLVEERSNNCSKVKVKSCQKILKWSTNNQQMYFTILRYMYFAAVHWYQ